MVDLTVENLVCDTDLRREIDLKVVAEGIIGVEYDPKSFPGAIYRIREPQVTLLIFSSGKVVCTGANSVENVKTAVSKLLEKLDGVGLAVEGEPLMKLQNIVASANIGFRIDLDKLAIECFNVEYEPEQFPGLVLRLEDPKTSILIFSTGKMVITGAKNMEDAIKAAQTAEEMIKNNDAQIHSQ